MRRGGAGSGRSKSKWEKNDSSEARFAQQKGFASSGKKKGGMNEYRG